MNFHRILPLASFSVFLTIAIASGDNSFHGIRNTKCGNDESAAKMLVFEKLNTDHTLCEAGTLANQTGGWSCHSGGECPKGKFRCNTQYVCGTAPSSNTPLPTLNLTMPEHAAPKVPGEKPQVQAVEPETHPNAPTPKGTEDAPYTAKSKREIKDGGSSYVEETITDDKGNKTTVVRPKTAKDTDIKPTALPSPAVPSPTPSSSTVQETARTLVDPAQKAMDQKVKVLDSIK